MKIAKIVGSVLALVWLFAGPAAASTAKASASDAKPEAADPLDACNVVWDSPGGNSSASMPIGNGDIGVNTWVEDNGDLLLLIGKTDAWCENSRILKVGRVRISLSNAPFAKGKPFRQELKLHDGTIEITGGSGNSASIAKIWVDAKRPVIRVECDGPQPFDVTAKCEIWRTGKRPFGEAEWSSCWHMNGAAGRKDIECFLTPDTIADGGDDTVIWYHRNEYSVWPIGMKLQGLESVMDTMRDPLLHRTFGAAIRGSGMTRKDQLTLTSGKAVGNHVISIYPLTSIASTAQEWQDQLNQNIKTVEAEKLAETRQQHQRWWHEFWQRSWIHISGDAGAETVTRGYALQRWMSACAGRGAYPFKFNGSIFTVEKRDGGNVQSDPDWRAWGGDYWWQNTRLPYWPMLASGDYDMMRPLFQMYMDTLPLAKARNKIWFNCEGAFIAETMSFWGLYSNGDYGWDRNGKQVGDVATPWIGRIWTGGLDLSMMMLDYYEHTQDTMFLKNTALPWADAMVSYFDTRFKRDAAGKLLITPAQAIETYQGDVVNPATDIAGLQAVVKRLLALPPDLTDKAARDRWSRFVKEIPELPMADKDGRKRLLPAVKYGGRSNCENPELYAIFPFRIYAMGKPDLEVGRDAYAARVEKAFHGWQQASIQAALLGLAAEAKSMVVSNASSHHGGSRFPAFWGPNYDWVPDQCHGGNLLNATQTMLLQAESPTAAGTPGKIYLFPAWPKEWDVSFKLHAPGNTTVEAQLRQGMITSLIVTPKSRAADVVNLLDK